MSMRTRNVAVVLAVCALAGACTTVVEQNESAATDELAHKLHAMGFSPAPGVSWPEPELERGDTAVYLAHADGRFAVLIHDVAGVEKSALVFDGSGEMLDTLSPTDADSPYAYYDARWYYCQIAVYSCYFSCMTACTFEPDQPSYCHGDCWPACSWYYDQCVSGAGP